MLDHIAGYRELREKREQLTINLIKDNISNLDLFEKLLGFHYEIWKKVYPIFKERHDQITNGQRHIKIQTKDITFNLCSYNMEYLFAAMESLKRGDLHATYNTIRPVYESIPKIFYVHHKPNDAFYMLLQGLYALQKPYVNYDLSAKNLNNDSKEILKKFLAGIKKSPSSHGYNLDVTYVNKKFKNKLTNKRYREQVYTDEQLENQNTMYGVLSSSSHANVTRFDGFARDYDENRNKFMKILVDITFVSFFLIASICHEELKQVGEIENTYNFLTNVSEEVGDPYQTTNLFPQKPEYTENLFIQPGQNTSNE